jgi:hypothetical protein
MLKVNIDPERVDVGLIALGSVLPTEAVEVAPPSARAAWLNIVEALPVLPDARITSRVRYLTQERATIGMFYDRRAPDADARLVTGIDQMAWSLGVARGHRELWKQQHPMMAGSPVTVTTACTADGPAPELTWLYREGTWDHAVDFCKVVASPDAARAGAFVLGSIAGMLALDQTEGVELTFAAGSPDVCVWLSPALTMTTRLSDELRGVFDQVTDARVPEAADLHAYFQGRGLSIKPAGPNLERPAWATIVAPEDAFVEIGGAVVGIRFGDDPRGYGAYVEIVVSAGTLQDVEAVTGPLSTTPPRSARHESLFVRAVIRGHRIPVYVVHDKGAVKMVTVQFDRNAS